MVPSRRLKHELARARLGFDDSQVTRIPRGDDDSQITRIPRGDDHSQITRIPRGDDDDTCTSVDLPWSDSTPEIEILDERTVETPVAPVVAAPPLPPLEDTRQRDRTMVRRLVDSVVAALPTAFKRAADRSQPIATLKTASAPAAVDARAWRELRTAPIFDGLPNEALRDALLSGEAEVRRLERDQLVPLDGQVALVRCGQVALAQFSAEVLRSERKASAAVAAAGGKSDKKERKRRMQVGPLMRLAEQNLATFEEGDVVETAVGVGGHATLGCYAVTPVVVLTLARRRVDLWKRIYPFMADRFRRAAAAARARLDARDGAKSAVVDFFIRHGLSVSMTLRVRKLDSCIECGACEQACEDRYGKKRLSLHYTSGAVAPSPMLLGGLDFVDACHTCTDQRCVDPCNFDAIAFDADRREILINEANCTGCTLCATACPYNAIEMHELDEAPLLKLRLESAGALAFGEGTPRKAKLRRMASKCDHCAFYADQACISACPTGALLEILPSDAVAQLPEQVRQIARAGFDRTAAIDVAQLHQPRPFTEGLALPELGRARAPRTRLLVGLWWAVGLAAWGAVLVEILLRKRWPQASLAYLLATCVEGIDPELARLRVDYRPGCELAVRLGYIGSAILASSMAYTWRRRLPWMRTWGPLQAWFDWHVLAGTVGSLFILLHTAVKLDNWVSIAFWSMILTVLSGLLGRYLTTQLDERAATASMETLEVSRELDELRRIHVGVRVADSWFEKYRTRVQKFERQFKNRAPTFVGALRTFAWVVRDDLARGVRVRRLAHDLRLAVGGRGAGRVRRKAVRAAHRLALLERRRALLPRLEPLFSRWKAVHVPMAVCFTVVATLHIALALLNG